MRTDLLSYLFSFVWPVAFLLLVCCFVPCPRGWRAHPGRRFAAMTVLAVGIVLIPVGGLPLGRWFTGLCANFSLPLLALMATVVGRRVFGAELLGKNGRHASTWFGVVSGGVLYPMAMGLGSADPYEAGWSFSWLFVGTGALAALLLWRGNRFGLVLFSAIGAWHLGLLESDNYWDYLVDPVSFVVSLAMGAAYLARAFRRTDSDRREVEAPVLT